MISETTAVKSQQSAHSDPSLDRPRSEPRRTLDTFNLVAFIALSLVGAVALLLINQGAAMVAGEITWAHVIQAGVIFISLFGASIYFAHESH